MRVVKFAVIATLLSSMFFMNNAFAYNTKHKDWIIRGQVGAFLPNTENDQYINGVYAGRVDGVVEGDSANSVAIELDATRFIFDYFAIEASLGVINGMATPQVDNRGRNIAAEEYLYLLPTGLNAQVHLAPYGVITPYVGAGVNYILGYNSGQVTHNFSKNIQFGADIWLKEYAGISLDIKRYFGVDAEIKPYQLNGNQIAQTADFGNPWLVMLGMAYRF